MTLPVFTLKRKTPLQFSEKGVQGEIYDPDGNDIGIYTLERPWKNNKIGESCIPAGKYLVTKRTKETHSWAKYPEAFELHGTEPRTGILIHAANWIRQLQGCIALGLAASDMPGGPMAVWRSRAAMKRFRKITPDKFYLLITDKQ